MTYDIIITGAGPIGLMLANLLAEQCDKSILITEQATARTETSRAIGITPPSLSILKTLNLDETFISQGHKITSVGVHNTKSLLGTLSLKTLPKPYSFILSLPQIDTEKILEENLRKYPHVTILKGQQVIAGTVGAARTELTLLNVETEEKSSAIGTYICACDGAKSILRTIAGVTSKGRRYDDTFIMGDFKDTTDLNGEAHLYFTKDGAVESFPLPNGRRRWVVQTNQFMDSPSLEFHISKVAERTGISLPPQKNLWLSPFGVQHFLNNSFYRGNIFFCGDSAHTMSPIGGQGMNTGFADAEFLARILVSFLREGKRKESLAKFYDTYRKRAVRSATGRAWLSMRVGTARGFFAPLRDLVIRLFLNSPLKKWGAPHFAMLTIPFGRLDKVLAKKPTLFQNK